MTGRKAKLILRIFGTQLIRTKVRHANWVGRMRIRTKDLLVPFYLAALSLVVCLVPRRYWPSVSRKCGSIVAALRHSFTRRNVSRIQTVLADHHIPATAREIEIERVSQECHDRLLILGQYRYPGWRPPLRLRGAEHLKSALTQGSGAVLWIHDCAGSRLLAKMALYEAGFYVSHLSRPTHGFIETEFGARFINRYWTRIEDRYLGERLMLYPGNHRPALDAMSQRLQDKQLVSTTVGPSAKRALELPFFSVHIKIPTAPIALAQKFSADLLPVFTKRSDGGGFEVIIDPPIWSAHTDLADQSIEKTAKLLTVDLIDFVAHHPGQWRGWSGLKYK